MNKTEITKAVEAAEKDFKKSNKEKQQKLVKTIVKETLEKIQTKIAEKKKIDGEIKTLKQDIENLKRGRLDLIEERQRKNSTAKATSLFGVSTGTKPNQYELTSGYWTWDADSSDWMGGAYGTGAFTICNSVARDSTPGTYVMSDGQITSIN